jgi:hypothetical protein
VSEDLGSALMKSILSGVLTRQDVRGRQIGLA